jgi:hypothetical protein
VGSRAADPTTNSYRGIDARLARLEDDLQHIEARLVRLDGVVQEMSRGLTRLTWTVNPLGATITMLLGITLCLSAMPILGHRP